MISFLIMLLLSPFVFILSLFVNTKKEYEKDSKIYRMFLNVYTWLMMRGLWIKVRVKGEERIPNDTRFLLVGNHRSNFDPILTWYALKQYNVAFISKEDNFKIPIFGRIIRRCCFMSIDRENPNNAIKTINRASELLKSDEVSVGVYPEGTRNKSDGLLPFHNGVFKIAQKADVPIVVLKVEGTENIHKRVPWKPSHITLNVVRVIDKETVKALHTHEIGEIVKGSLEYNF